MLLLTLLKQVWLCYFFTRYPELVLSLSFVGIGRGLTPEGAAATGQRRGVYILNGLKGTVYSFDDVTDGAPNFCIENWDLEKETIKLSFSRIEQ